jgi:oxygen-dependent protoporphyrinogen oxidase
LHPDAEALLRAAINRVSAEPEVLSAGAGIAQFAATFNGRRSLYHRNLPGGTAVLVDRLAALLAERIVTDARVTSVRNTTNGVQVTASCAGRRIEISAGAAIVATQAFVTRQIVDDLPQGLSNALAAIRYGPYVVMALLTNERRPMPWDDVYAVVVASKAFNMFFNTASVLRGAHQRSAGGSLTVYGAASLGAELLDASDQTIAETFRRDLRSVFPEVAGIEEEVIVQRWEHGIPYSTPGRSGHQKRLEEPFGRIVLAGDYLGERGGMDTAATSGLEAASAVRAVLEQRQLTAAR